MKLDSCVVENVKRPLRRNLVAAVVLLLAPALSSCGFDKPTDRVYTPSVGVNERSISVDVLHALVVSGTDGTGTLIAGLSNGDQAEADTLSNITPGGEAAFSVTGGGPVEVPAGGFVQLADDGGVPLEGDAITAGAFVAVTFTFERAGSVTLEVPVVDQRGDYEDIGE